LRHQENKTSGDSKAVKVNTGAKSVKKMWKKENGVKTYFELTVPYLK
jgi:hypothetical protein